MDPTCKVAIVLGAAKGSGFRAAEELLKAGVVRVVLADFPCPECYNATEKLCDKYGSEKAVLIAGDFHDPKMYMNLFEESIARFQKVDILFNNLDNYNDNSWVEEVNCNIKNTVRSTLLTHYFMNKKRNKDSRGSVVINCAISYSLDTMPPMPIYCSTKSAIIGFSRSIGDVMHYERTGVRVVALCPGITKEEAFSSSEYSVQLENSWGLDMEKLNVKEPQSDSSIARAVVHLVRYAPSGSVWVLDNDNLFYAEIPHRSLYNKRGNFVQPICKPPVLVPRPQRRRSSSDARSYVCVSKLHLYRVKGKNKKRSSRK
ncbi:hypothetical protein L9F63_005784 [Diploptera punctata]|uniref:15-hydroxyprostaglandin dehydrogenase [NAD(+)] n=1 Tax=Diploptera punctata TaxID=6984 RepID=A0AAD7ZC53_DIPPU|nr:hypothetical protein L9F63_005784 [Diploptera punctata]